MTMNRLPNPLIDALADDLAPVRPMTARAGLAWVAAALAATLVAVELLHGLWHGAFAGEADPLFWIANGLLLLLGAASAASAVRMAGPRVGNRHEAPRWALAAVAVLPLAALATVLSDAGAGSPLHDPYGVKCALASLAAAGLTAVVLVAWLRRGAPVSLAAAGFHTGLAAGALGSVAYGLSCPIDEAAHLGIWHVLPVFVAGLAGRWLVPPLVRW